MTAEIALPVMVMTALGLFFGLGLAYALKIFGIEVDPQVALIITKLPGSNCGACGKAGCSGFAEALKKGEVIPASCVLSEEETREAISEILGIKYSKKIKKVAIVKCAGGKNAKDKFTYQGLETCKAATLLFGGHKECIYGCLGLGDCVRACAFDAIEIKDELAVINPDKCVACGKCVEACPTNIISMEELDEGDKVYYVACSSPETASVKRKICSASCIACYLCEKLSSGAYEVKNNLAKLDYEKLKKVERKDDIVLKCPTKVIKVAATKPKKA